MIISATIHALRRLFQRDRGVYIIYINLNLMSLRLTKGHEYTLPLIPSRQGRGDKKKCSHQGRGDKKKKLPSRERNIYPLEMRKNC